MSQPFPLPPGYARADGLIVYTGVGTMIPVARDSTLIEFVAEPNNYRAARIEFINRDGATVRYHQTMRDLRLWRFDPLRGLKLAGFVAHDWQLMEHLLRTVDGDMPPLKEW